MKTVAIQKKSSIQNVRMLTMTAVLSAIAFALAFFEFPVPLSPSFARMDLSDLPALIGAFAYGPAAGILIELVKNALQLLTSSTGGIGELANFIMGSSFVAVAGLIYKFHKTKKTALIACLTSSNSSLYIALCSNYGDASDAGAISVFCIKDGPFVTMMVLGVSGLANIPFAALLSMLIPLLIGMLWGNLDERFKQLCAAAQPLVIIIMSFAIGANSSINTVFTAGLSGILLGIISALTGIVFYFIYNLFLKKKSALGAALGTTAASSALTPAMVAQADPSLAMYVDAATAQLATASIITMITAPILVAWFDKRLKKRASAAEPLKEVKSEESVTLSSPAAKGHK